MAYQKQKEKMAEITKRLEQGVKEVFESENYRNYLAVMSRFHNYSSRNSLLISMQMPKATHVAGYNSWKNNFKRQVNKGEKGIEILAPTPYKIKKEMEKTDPGSQRPVLDNLGKPIKELVEVTMPAFKPVYVFDVSQTSGEPLPELAKELTGSVKEYQVFFESLKEISPFPIQFEEIQNGAKGYCNYAEKKIAINSGMSEIQNLKTAVHEIAHANLHAKPTEVNILDVNNHRNVKEVEAESVAFVVCNYFGIDTSDYSFEYIAAWSEGKELKELESSLSIIQKQASELIGKVDANLNERIKDRVKPEKTTPNRGKQEAWQYRPKEKTKSKVNKKSMSLER